MAVSICNVHTNQKNKDTTSYGSPDFPIACYEDDMRLMNVPVHWHDEFEYIIAVKGIVTVLANTEQYELKSGDSIFINSGCLHGVKAVTEGDSVLRSLVILPKVICGSSDSIFFKRLIFPFSVKDAPACIMLADGAEWQRKIAEDMLEAWRAVTDEIYDSENEARYRISRAMRSLADHLTEKSSCKSENVLLERVKLSISFMEKHFADDIGNQDLMELLGCSESVLLRSFRQVAGTSPMQFLINYRVQKAAEMLLTTELRACDVAVACGFHDFSYFTKMFKRSMGMTPMQYRNIS